MEIKVEVKPFKTFWFLSSLQFWVGQANDGWKKGLLCEICKLKANKKMANTIEAGKKGDPFSCP